MRALVTLRKPGSLRTLRTLGQRVRFTACKAFFILCLSAVGTTGLATGLAAGAAFALSEPAAASPLLDGTPAQPGEPTDAKEKKAKSKEPEGRKPEAAESGDSERAAVRFEPSGEGEPSRRQQALSWVIAQQRALHRQLAEGIETLREAPSLSSAIALITISFLYGVFHAVGPGHGKAVITTYLLTHRQNLRRGLTMSFAAALLQGITAVVAVSVVLFVAGRAARDALGQTALLEQLSFALVSLLGLWLCSRALRALWQTHRRRTTTSASENATSCGCGHAAAHHHHHIDPQQATHGDSRWAMVATVAAVGARPCAGAILVLVVAHLLGIWSAGVVAVLAMSIGTGLTVATLATLAVLARHHMARYTGPPSHRLQLAAHTLALCGGLLILAIGATLLTGSLTLPKTPHPLGL